MFIQELEVHKSLCVRADSTAFSALTHKVGALVEAKDKN